MKELLKELKLFWNQSQVIAWQDFKRIGLSPFFFATLSLSFIFLSYLFPRELFKFASSYIVPAFQQGPSQGNIHYAVFVPHVSYINLLLLFFIPALSMKLLSEEKKNHTFDLLMTAPLSSLHIVIGKYFALLMILIFFLLMTSIYPFSTAFFTEIPMGPLLTSYLGLFLLSATYAAAGLFGASLTSSSVLGVIMGVILNISLWFISQGRDFSDQPIFLAVMEYLSLGSHLTNFVKGSLVISSFVFFFSCILFFLFLVYKVIEFSRWRS